MSDIDEAVRRFRDEHFACAQALLSTYGPRYGLPREPALRLADAFGGGMGGLGRTCGAVTGAVMVIGLAYGRTRADDAAAKLATTRRVQQFVARFTARHGSTTCHDLIGCAIDTPEKVAAARERGVFDRVCVELVRVAATLLEEALAE